MTRKIQPLFERVDPPRSQARLPINRVAQWYSWSPEFVCAIRELRPFLRSLPEPTLIRVRHLTEYGDTFHVPAETPQILTPFVRSLSRLPRPRGIMLFTGLLDGPMDGFALRRLFALLRHSIAGILGDERFSLYAPLGDVGANAGDFALHCDLYLPELLFNVFEEVAADTSGTSLFLSVAHLLRIMKSLPRVPRRVMESVADAAAKPLKRDSFDKLYGLLHGSRHPWAAELERAMSQRQERIKLNRGQGYLVHDRAWLHGREAASGGVSIRRVHRLVFNTIYLQRRVGQAD